MPNCSRCGKFINVNEVYKREIYSGKTNKIYYGKRISFGNNFRYSIKSVCQGCAMDIDRENQNSFYFWLVIVLIAIAFIITFLIK